MREIDDKNKKQKVPGRTIIVIAIGFRIIKTQPMITHASGPEARRIYVFHSAIDLALEVLTSSRKGIGQMSRWVPQGSMDLNTLK